MSPSSIAAGSLLAMAVFVLMGPAGGGYAEGLHADGSHDGGSGDGGSRGGGSRAGLRAGWPFRATRSALAADADVSTALALLALAYRSGLPTWDVLEAVAAGLGGAAAHDLRQVATALRWGADESEAWASVGPAWAPASRAVAIAHQAGVPPGAMLLAASDDLRNTELERLERSAAKVGVRLVAPLGLVLLPAFCLTTVAPLVIALAGDVLRG
jgi:pilus assembly protein TadC